MSVIISKFRPRTLLNNAYHTKYLPTDCKVIIYVFILSVCVVNVLDLNLIEVNE